MKRILLILLCFLLIAGAAICESPTTPTDLEEYAYFEDGDYGYIDPALIHRQVHLQWLKEPKYFGDECTLVVILIDFRPNDICTFEWLYSLDGEEWNTIPDATEQTYTFILDHENYQYWWRVIVTVEEDV